MVIATVTAFDVVDPTAIRRAALVRYRDARHAALRADAAYRAVWGSDSAKAAGIDRDRADQDERAADFDAMTPYQRNVMLGGGGEDAVVDKLRNGPSVIMHGMDKSPERQALHGMIRRCTDPSDKNFAAYGGKGVTVDPLWMESPEGFVRFYDHVGPRPLGGDHSIDRIDARLSYVPGNVRWATTDVQFANKRSEGRDRLGVDNVVVALGVSRLVWEWAAEFRCSCTKLAYAFASKPSQAKSSGRLIAAFGQEHAVEMWATAFACSAAKLDAALLSKPTVASSSRRAGAATHQFVMDCDAVERYRFEKRAAVGWEAARRACSDADQGFTLEKAVDLALSIERETAHSSGTDPFTALYVEIEWVEVERRRGGLR